MEPLKPLTQKLTLFYPNGKKTTAFVRSTVCPSKKELGAITDYNKWAEYIRIHSDYPYGARMVMENAVANDLLMQKVDSIIKEVEEEE